MNRVARLMRSRRWQSLSPGLFCVSALMCVPLASCVVGPDYQRPALALPAMIAKPELEADATRGTLEREWWRRFGSKALNDLMDEALQKNPGVEAAQAALRSAGENVRAQEGAYAPQIGLGYSANRQRTASVYAPTVATNDYIYTVHTAQLTVGFAPDVFGLNRRAVEGLQAQQEFQVETLEATRLTLVGNLVVAVVTEAGLREQIHLVQAQIRSQTVGLATTRRLWKLGAAAEADVRAQELQLANLQAVLPPMKKQLDQTRDALRVLSGRYPSQAPEDEFHLSDFEVPADIPLTLPADLLARRPDVRAAEASLRYANAQIGVARANRLPQISLAGSSIGQASSTLSQLLDPANRLWSLAVGVTQPVFDGGTLAARERSAYALRDQAAAQYRATVLAAFQSVADALTAVHNDTTLVQRQWAAAEAAHRAAEIAKAQVKAGDLSPFAALALEQAEVQAKLQWVQAKTNHLADTAALCQALAGSWATASANTQESGL